MDSSKRQLFDITNEDDRVNSDEERRSKPHIPSLSVDRQVGGTRTMTYNSLNQGRVYTSPSQPKALCLTVFLDPKAFISLEPKYQYTVRDIKIDGMFV